MKYLFLLRPPTGNIDIYKVPLERKSLGLFGIKALFEIKAIQESDHSHANVIGDAHGADGVVAGRGHDARHGGAVMALLGGVVRILILINLKIQTS